MRLLPLSLLFALCTSAIAEAPEKPLGAVDAPDVSTEASADDAPKLTIFNGVEVPPIPDIDGEKYNATVKDGYWFVKHHSPYCPHCIHLAPTWQTLHEFYYTSKPVPAGPASASAETASTSMNTFHAYYNFHFGSLDCVAFGSACSAHGVTSFPTFVLYKDGEELKRFEGAKDMEGLSDFVEETLEAIKPGSRPIGGPQLPAPGDKQTKENKGTAETPEVTSVVEDTKDTIPGIKGTTVKDTGGTPADFVKGGSPVQKKPSRLTSTANALGTSVSFTAESFQNLVTMSQDPWFIKFYAPWCGHCQALAPTWVQLGKEMKGKLNVGEVNCDVESRLCKDVHLRGFPTILFFRGGERVEYEGLRGLGDFVSYANNAIEIGDGVRDINAIEFEELEEKEEVIFLYFYDHATTTEDFIALERLTLSLIGHAQLVKTNSAKLAERYKITTWPRLLVSRDGVPTYYTALAPQDMRDFRQVLHWMQSVWLPIVPELTASNSREIMDGKLVVLAILTRDRSDEFIMAKKEVKSAALEWMDKQTLDFQRERQELRDAKQLRIEEAEDRNDRQALKSAKAIRINMDKAGKKEVGFAWVDGVFWERWIRTTYGIDVSKDGEKVIMNDEDNRRYWDQTITGNSIMASRTSILETIKTITSSNPGIKPKSTIGAIKKFFFNLRGSISGHPFLSGGLILGSIVGGLMVYRGKFRRSKGGFFRLDEKDGLLSGNMGGKVD